METNKDPARELARLRSKRRLSLRDLAERTGISSSTLQRWESGRILPDTGSLRVVLNALGAPPSSVATKPDSGAEFDDDFGTVPIGAVLRVARGRLALSVERASDLMKVSPSTFRRWELGTRSVPPIVIPRLIDRFELTESEAQHVRGGYVAVEDMRLPDRALLSRWRQLEADYRRGAGVDGNLTCLRLLHAASYGLQRGTNSVEALFKIRAGYIDYLIWHYRRREAYELAQNLPFRFVDRPNLEGWSPVVRAHWQFIWERANNEMEVVSYLRRRSEIHSGSPSAVDIAMDLAWRLGLTGRPAEGLELLERTQQSEQFVASCSRTIYLAKLVGAGLGFMLGRRRKALDHFPKPPTVDLGLRVSAATARAKMLAEIGDASGAVTHLTELREEVGAKHLAHFAGVLDRRAQNGGTYLDRW